MCARTPQCADEPDADGEAVLGPDKRLVEELLKAQPDAVTARVRPAVPRRLRERAAGWSWSPARSRSPTRLRSALSQTRSDILACGACWPQVANKAGDLPLHVLLSNLAGAGDLEDGRCATGSAWCFIPRYCAESLNP